MLAKIEAKSNGDLFVTDGQYEWRRVAGQWQMLGRSGEWFACEIQDHIIKNQVTDFECCLRAYTFAQGPDYPKGRRHYESVSVFIQRLQLASLREGAKNIFAPVATNYTPGAEQARRRAAEARRRSGPIGKQTEQEKYDEAIAAKRAAAVVVISAPAIVPTAGAPRRSVADLLPAAPSFV